MLIGPWGLNWISNPEMISDFSNIGIIFLLFLLGLNLEVGELTKMFREAILITVVSSAVFFMLGALIAALFQFNGTDIFLTGLVMVFSSTIVSVKAATHQRTSPSKNR